MEPGLTTSLRRHYPDQVIRVLSQPLAWREHPGKTVTKIEKNFSVGCNIPRKLFVLFRAAATFFFVVCLLKNIDMKKAFLLSLLISSAISLLAQQQINDRNAQKRDVKSFHAISVATGIELHLSQGGSEALAVSASSEEYRNRIVTEVVDGVLKIYYDNNWWQSLHMRNMKTKAYVSFVKLDQLKISSGASVKTADDIHVPELHMTAGSGGSFDGKVKVGKLEVAQHSGASIQISGTVSDLKIEGSSGSVFDGYDLVADNCEAITSSGSGIQVTVNKELSAHASSGGHIHYKGAAAVTHVITGSGGSVSKKS